MKGVIEVLDGTVVFALFDIGIAPEDERIGVVWIDSQGLVIVLARAVIIGLVRVRPATAIECLSVIWFDP